MEHVKVQKHTREICTQPKLCDLRNRCVEGFENQPLTMRSLDEFLDMFRFYTRKFWDNGSEVLSKITLKAEIMNIDAWAALKYHGNPKVIRHSVYFYPREYTLIISPYLFTQKIEFIEKIIKHEVLHIGYGRHTNAFLVRARELGVIVSENDAIHGFKYIIQIKPKGTRQRYQTWREYTEDEFKGAGTPTDKAFLANYDWRVIH